MKKILLIDGNSIMNRAFYGIMGQNLLKTKSGKYTNAILGFLSILFKNLEELSPEYLCIAFDSKTASSIRKQIYDGYKKSRKSMPEELREQMYSIKEILAKMQIKTYELQDFEGDDILGSIAKKMAKQDIMAYILSGDRDLFQLVEENINIKIPRTKAGKTETEIYDIKKLKEEYGLLPNQLIDLKSLMGDSSDEIPGAKGIGEKTATNLIKKYGNIDNLYENLEKNIEKEFTPKVRKSLEESKELVYISRQIGEININANVSENIEEYKINDWKNEEVRTIFEYYELNKFLEKYFDTVKKTNKKSESIKLQDIVIEDALKYDEFTYYIDKNDVNDSEEIIQKEINKIVLLFEKKYKLELTEISDIKTFFENNQKKIGYNISEDYILLKQYGIDMKNIYFDIGIAIFDLYQINIKDSLETIVNKYIDIELNSIENIVYAINEIYEKTNVEFVGKERELFFEIEMPILKVLSDMKLNGIGCDGTVLKELGNNLSKRINELTTEIHKLAGEEFNINSTKQLGVILFEKLGLKAGKKTKTGYSTNVEILEGLKDFHEIIPLLLEYRTLAKLNSTYIEGLIETINKKTGRIHSTFNQTITVTGRLSSTNPNLQNIPERYEIGKDVKKAFKARDGYVFLDADYSQVELRILSALSGDENMIKSFKNGIDIHREVASKVFNVELENVTKEQRTQAKAVNFGIVYGITDRGLSEQLNITRKEAAEYIKNYLEKYSKIKEYMDSQIRFAEKEGFVETFFGRKRYIKEISSSNFNIREFGKRAAMNTTIQGTAADIMKIAMINFTNRIKEENLDAKLLLQVHDELLIEVVKEQAEKVKEILINSMQNAAKLEVELLVEAKEATNWFDAK